MILMNRCWSRSPIAGSITCGGPQLQDPTALGALYFDSLGSRTAAERIGIYWLNTLSTGSLPAPVRKCDDVGNVAAQLILCARSSSKEAALHFLSVSPRYSNSAEKDRHRCGWTRPNLNDKAALEATQGSYFAVMRSFLLQVSKEMGYHVIDMQPRFIDRHIMDQARFEWPFDGHWNSKGHEEAALAVINSGFLKRSMAPFNRH